jgi:SAM-dependent methyltransferase
MNDSSQTWHYGLVARHWAENNITGPEIAFYLRMIDRYGQPALDAGCGTGRLLIPFLRAGLDVDGCDVSEDMLAYCQQAAEREGFAPRLYRQALQQLDVSRVYQTIVACGVFGVGVSRAQDFIALQRFHQHLAPGGVLVFDVVLPYSDGELWPLWQTNAQKRLPEAWAESIGTPPLDGRDYQLHYRLVAVNSLEQQTTGEMRTLLFKDGHLLADDTYRLISNYYFPNEVRLLLEKAGFTVEAEKGDWMDTDVTADHQSIVFVARKR